MSWLFVDDEPDAAKAFADQLGGGAHPLKVDVVGPDEARKQLLTAKVKPAGVLMDVELSNTPGELGSGPGLAQDLRVKQKAKAIDECPIVRFAGRAPVAKNVKHDPGSDDLFDLKILKETLAGDLTQIQLQLTGVQHVYEGLNGQDVNAKDALTKLLGLAEDQLRWSHEGFHDRLLSAMQSATHVAAGAFMRGFLTPTGLLISETVLGYRLGVDPAASGTRWKALLTELPFNYKGIAANYFPRWWARGLEDWWFEAVRSQQPLVSLTIAQRAELLAKKFDGLVALAMPQGSDGQKPWRLCALSLEEDPPAYVPIDPTEAVRLTPRADPPAWTDPTHASLRLALQQQTDFRLNRADLDRLKRKHRIR